MKMIVTIFLATLMLPSLSWARSSTSTYTKNEIEAKFNELRTFYEARTAPQSEIASRFDTLEAKLKQLIDANEGLANERGLLSRQVEDLQAQVKQNEQAEWDRNQLFVETLKSIQASSAFSWLLLLPAIVGALVSGAVIWWVAHVYTLDIKMVESTLAFSGRFGELIQRQSELNQGFAQGRVTQDSPPTVLETTEAHTWWWRFFDLILFEYDFFRQGLVWKEQFKTWMLWRWHDYHAQGNDVWKTNGIGYREGWAWWKTRPANMGSRLERFLDEVHAGYHPDRVRQIVEEHKPKLLAKLFRLRRLD